MEKARDLFKKTRNIKRTFHAKMGTIKDRNDKDITEAENIKILILLLPWDSFSFYLKS